MSGIVGLFEFRGEKVEDIKWIDRDSGKAQSMKKHTVAGEIAGSGEQVAVDVYVPRGSEPVLLGFRKGDLFTGDVMMYLVSKGKAECRLRNIVNLSSAITAAASPAGKEYPLQPVK